MVSENALQIVVYLKQLEKEQEIKENFLSTSLVTGKMRAVLINWLAEVHMQFKLMQETLYLTVSIVDRYDIIYHFRKVKLWGLNSYLSNLTANLVMYRSLKLVF